MAFTNVWDNTFPPDTQAANQLGADLRNFRTDVQQRMAAISGLEADKPAFEAGFAGVLYFATDTGKIFRWNGASWLDVTSLIIAAVTPASLGLSTVATSGLFADLLGISGMLSVATEAVGAGTMAGTFVKFRFASDGGTKYIEIAIGLGTGKTGDVVALPSGYSPTNSIMQASYKYSNSGVGNGLDNAQVVTTGLTLTDVVLDRISSGPDSTNAIAMWVCVAWNIVS
jgi:hypothetical protein